ncbi:TATA element modulatory factor-like [Actinia tenebrosa]|uniref:TATA element modulatory factor-like n=1 Tax=Actinia tenebrosa TaxID=6105 RepID=A0A6P8IDA1_ACTTE|nr:TATA element modulatory factor-like [Actinia tenebrosa]
MSWFDASSFTSYAKTALASAQKSIDKVLDIDETTAASSKNKNADVKDKESTESASVNTQKESGVKLQSSKPQSNSNTSTQKDSSKDNSSVDGGGDFWSSFLGTSSASSASTLSSSSSSSSADKKTKTLPSSKQNDSKVQNKRTSNHGETLEKRRQKKRENRINDSNGVTKNQNQKERSNNEDLKAMCDKEASHDMKDGNGKIHIGNEMRVSSTDSSGQQTPHKSYISKDSKELSPLNDEKLNEAKTENIFPIKDEQKLQLVKENNLGNKREILRQVDGIKKENDQTGSTFKSEKMGKELKDNDTENTGEVKYYEGKETSNLSPETLESQSVTEDSENLDVVSKNIESLLHTAPRATSTPYTEKLKVLTGDEHVCEDDVGLSRKTKKSLLTEGGKSRPQEQEETGGRKEPVEDECDGEDVITGSVYTVEENMQDEEDNLEKSSSNDVIEIAESIIKLSKQGESTKTSPTLEKQDSEDINLEVTGELTKDETSPAIEKQESQEDNLEVTGELTKDYQNLVKEKEHESALSEESLEEKTVAAQENRNEEPNSIQVQTLLKEVSGLKELVDARESKMVALSKENIDLQETNAILRSQLEQLEKVHNSEDEEFEEMKEEFTTRIAATENKFHEVAKERDDLKMELEETRNNLTAIYERQKEELTTIISEKDEQIVQLLAEGEKLSKQELQSNMTIRKLRAKEKENDTLIKKQTKKLEEYENEVKRLTDILTSRDDSHSKQEDAIIKLNAYVKKQEEQLSKQTSELEDANEKVRSMQVALDNAYKEMTSLQKQAASSDSSIQEAVLSAEMKAKEELRIALEKARREYGQDSELMALQISDLQTNLSRAEKQAIRREESLREEIKDLQQRIQEAEDRNQDLAASVSHATRPLLRQIENLQATHSGQASTWEMVEKNLTERLNEAQSQLLAAQEKERVASRNVSELNSRITRLESQVNSYRTERARLEAELELERTKVGSLEDIHSREVAKSDAVVKKYKKLIEEANMDKAHLEQQLAVEKSRLETELKKVKAALENKEKLLSRQSSLSNAPPPSPSDNGEPNQDDEAIELKTHIRKTSSSSSVVDGLARGFLGGTTELVERLQAQIRQKDGEIKVLQDEVTSLRQSRDSVMEELTKMISELHDLETSHEQLILLKAKYDDLEQRYNAVLQMYGEKEEEAEELRMDLHDVKSMYKQQLEQLFGSTR